MGKHKCKNHIINRKCLKCGRPEWSLDKENPLKIGDVVRLPRYYTYGYRIFKIHKFDKKGVITLEFVGGKEKGTLLAWFDWWELKHIRNE